MAISEAQLRALMQAQQQEQREQVLYSFKAGNMEVSGRTVTADPRKGKVVLTMEDDGLLRFQWRLRHKDDNEQQYFVFPDGADFKRVQECKDGIVFLLKFKDSDVRRFWWCQEPTGDGAEKKASEIVRRVSALLKNPPKWGSAAPTWTDEADSAAAAEEEDATMSDAVPSVTVESQGDTVTVQGTGHSVPSPARQEQRGSVVTPAAVAGVTQQAAQAASSAAASHAAPAAGTNELLSALNAMAAQLQARQQQQQERPGVEDVLEAERVQPILDVDRALVDALVQYLPEGQRSPDALRAQLRSPQLQQAMSRLTQLLNSAQFGQLMASLSLPLDANTGIGVDGFLAAIQQQADRQRQQQQGGGQGGAQGGNGGAQGGQGQ